MLPFFVLSLKEFGLSNKIETAKKYNSFKEFYPFYLSQHADLTCRRLHFIGSFFVLVVIAIAVIKAKPMLLLLLPVIGYGFAWVGHFGYEKNKPATFTYPIYSLMGDWVMFWQILKGEISITHTKSKG